MQSMTGYGRGSVSADGREMTIELKSVNHRFLDISMRLPRHLLFLEDPIRKEISGTLSRGHIDVFLNYRNLRSDAKQITVNASLLASYITSARTANETLGLPDDFSLTAALNLPDVTEVSEADEDQEAVLALCSDAVGEALASLCRTYDQWRWSLELAPEEQIDQRIAQMSHTERRRASRRTKRGKAVGDV